MKLLFKTQTPYPPQQQKFENQTMLSLTKEKLPDIC
jgi:hypothetical protein